MVPIVVGALFVVVGIVVAAVSTLKRGRLSEADQPVSHAPRDTLEPTGRGRRLSMKTDLPGVALIVIGVAIMVLGTL